MQVIEKIVDSRRLAQDVAIAKYKDAPRVKLAKKEYENTLRSMHLSAKINLSEILLRMHKTNPYQSIDELIGDLQVVLVNSWKEFRTLNFDVEMGSLSIEDLISDLPEKIKQHE